MSPINIKYAIIEVDPNNDKEIIIDYVNTSVKFTKKVKQFYPEYDLLDSNLDVKSLKDSHYLIQDNNSIDLIKKTTTVSNSWFYADTVDVQLIKKWKLIEVKLQPKQLLFKNFDVNKIYKKNISTLLIGGRAVGKTTTISNILDKYDENVIKNSLIIHSANYYDPIYTTKYPNAKILSEYDENYIKQFLEEKKDNYGIIVFDDCLNTQKTPNIEYLFGDCMSTYNKQLFLTIQYPLGLSSKQFDYTFIFNSSYISNQKRIYEQYAGMFPKFSLFQPSIKNLKQGHSLVIENNCKNDILDKVFNYP